MKKSKLFYIFGIILLILIIIAIFVPYIAPYDPQYIDITKKLQHSTKEHIMGTDHLGRDIFSRLLYGMRLSISISFIITVGTLIISFPIGILAGWYGGRFDRVFLWIVKVFMAFPSFLLSMALVGILGQGINNIVISIILIEWVYYSRIIRNIVESVKNENYVLASKIMGASSIHIIKNHIFPIIVKPILVIALMNIGNIILMISGFSFLGIGVQPNIAEWGMMLNDAKPYFRRIPQLVMYPGFAIFITVLTFNLFSEGLDKNKEVRNKWKD